MSKLAPVIVLEDHRKARKIPSSKGRKALLRLVRAYMQTNPSKEDSAQELQREDRALQGKTSVM